MQCNSFWSPGVEIAAVLQTALCSPCPHCSGAGFYVTYLVLERTEHTCPVCTPCIYVYICLLISVFFCSVLLYLVRSYELSNCSLFVTRSLQYTIAHPVLLFLLLHVSFPGLAFYLRGSSLCWSRLPVFWSDGPGALLSPAGRLSRWLSWIPACLFDRPSSFRSTLLPSLWALPGGFSLLFSPNFSVLNLRTLFFSPFNPADPSFFRLTPMFFRLLFPDPSVFAFLAPPRGFSQPAPLFFPPTRGFSPVLFVFSGFFATRSFPSGLLSVFQAVLAPSLWHLGFVRRFFCACRPSSGFSHSPRPFLFPPLPSSAVSPGAASSSRVTFGFVSTG